MNTTFSFSWTLASMAPLLHVRAHSLEEQTKTWQLHASSFGKTNQNLEAACFKFWKNRPKLGSFMLQALEEQLQMCCVVKSVCVCVEPCFIGLAGNDRIFSSLFVTDENKRIQHEKRTIFLSYSEESLRARRGLVRGVGSLHQVSWCYVSYAPACSKKIKDNLLATIE